MIEALLSASSPHSSFNFAPFFFLFYSAPLPLPSHLTPTPHTSSTTTHYNPPTLCHPCVQPSHLTPTLTLFPSLHPHSHSHIHIPTLHLHITHPSDSSPPTLMSTPSPPLTHMSPPTLPPSQMPVTCTHGVLETMAS